jgi:hypothetical protein
VRIRQLNWDADQARQFIANRFGGRRRAQLTDAELLRLLEIMRSL